MASLKCILNKNFVCLSKTCRLVLHIGILTVNVVQFSFHATCVHFVQEIFKKFMKNCTDFTVILAFA